MVPVLRADSRQPMLDWLKQNRYFVPATPTDVLAPYIRPGAFCLALKLRTGKGAGDLEPLILTDPSDLKTPSGFQLPFAGARLAIERPRMPAPCAPRSSGRREPPRW